MSEGWLVAAKLLAVVALILLNGFFVASEFALVSVRRSRIDQMAEEGVAGAGAVRNALTNLDRLLAAAQLGITIASLAIGWLGEPTIGHFLEEWLHWAPAGGVIAVVIAFAIITALHIVIGEQAPKLAALQHPERTSILVARPLALFDLVFRPFILALNAASRATMRLLGLRGDPGHGGIYTPEELKLLVEASGKAGVLEESEREIIDRAFEFADFSARELMMPRTEVVAVPADLTGRDFLHTVVAAGFSRYPVYDGSLDRVVGIIHVKDLLAALDRAALDRAALAAIRVGALARPALVVPETLAADELLERLRGTNARMAIVIDEFGGMAGVVTMENLLERLVGGLRDEFEAPAPADAIENPDGSLSLSGLTNITDANDRYGLGLDDNEYDTLGGFVFGRIGHLPEVGDAVEFNGHRLTVEAMDDRRIARVLVAPTADQPSDVDGSPTGSR